MSVSKSTPTAKKTIAVTKSAGEKKPATKKITAKSASKAAPAKAATPKPRATKPAPAKKKAVKGNGETPITPEQRYRMICDAAYYRAERRGFIGGNPAEDWTAAESEIDGLLLSMQH